MMLAAFVLLVGAVHRTAWRPVGGLERRFRSEWFDCPL